MSSSGVWAKVPLFAALLLLPATAFAQESRPAHPLDALTGAELKQAKSILAAAGKIGSKAQFHSIDLVEPDKAAVTAWRPGGALPRRAIAVVSEDGKVNEAAIDLSAGQMTNWQAVTGGPALLFGETYNAGGMALADPRMVEGLAKRGLRPNQVYCLPLTSGNFGAKEPGQRLLKVPCFVRPMDSHYWAQPVEGLFATVDLKTGKAIDVTDTGAVPVPAGGWGYNEAEIAARGALRPETKLVSLVQPNGDNITT